MCGLRRPFRFQRNRAGRKAAAVFALHKCRCFRFLFRVKASHFLVRQESGKEVSALAGLRPSFRFQRNRAGRSHAARVLLRAQNSLRSFWGPARKPGTFRSAKKHKFQRQQLANLCFFNASLRWPRNPACGPRAGLAPGWPRHAPAGAERQTRWRFPSRAKQQE